MKVLLYTLGLLFVATSGVAEVPSAEIEVNTKTVAYEETLQVTLQLILPKDYQPNSEAIGEQLLITTTTQIAPFSLVEVYSDDPTIQDEIIIYRFHYILEPWQAGNQKITFGTLAIKGKEIETPLYITTPVVKIVVESAKIKTKDIIVPSLLPLPGRPLIGISSSTWSLLSDNIDHDEVQAQHHLEQFRKKSFPWKIVVIVFIVLFVCYLIRRALPKILFRLQDTSVMQATAKDKALDALQRLIEADLPAAGRYDTFYVALTGIVRRYIEDKYGVKAPEQTTEEFLQKSSKTKIFDVTTQSLLKNFLYYADLVKFAHISPSIKNSEEAIIAAREIIE